MSSGTVSDEAKEKRRIRNAKIGCTILMIVVFAVVANVHTYCTSERTIKENPFGEVARVHDVNYGTKDNPTPLGVVYTGTLNEGKTLASLRIDSVVRGSEIPDGAVLIKEEAAYGNEYLLMHISYKVEEGRSYCFAYRSFYDKNPMVDAKRNWEYVGELLARQAVPAVGLIGTKRCKPGEMEHGYLLLEVSREELYLDVNYAGMGWFALYRGSNMDEYKRGRVR